MSRAGRKRKRPISLPGNTLAHLAAIERANRMAETALVLSQPHRRGSNATECESALGRFCLTLGENGRSYLRAGEQYGALVGRWRAAWGAQQRNPAPATPGTGEGPSDSRVRAWRAEIDEIDGMLNAISCPVRFAVVRLCVDERDILPSAHLDARHGLHCLAVHFGLISARVHPFADH